MNFVFNSITATSNGYYGMFMMVVRVLCSQFTQKEANKNWKKFQTKKILNAIERTEIDWNNRKTQILLVELEILNTKNHNNNYDFYFQMLLYHLTIFFTYRQQQIVKWRGNDRDSSWLWSKKSKLYFVFSLSSHQKSIRFRMAAVCAHFKQKPWS